MTTSPTTLSSAWDGLSEHLIASFYPVERQGGSRFWQPVDGAPTVRAPLTECTLDMSLNWQSPFENAGTSTMPTLQAMLASGAFEPWVKDNGKGFISTFEGRTGITKLNSQQIFSGMPPIKFQVTALFRAWKDPVSEVTEPIDQLMLWVLPQSLADDGPILSALENLAKGEITEAMLPSVAPTKIAMKYKQRLYMPLVIESVNLPLGSPVNKDGHHVEMPVTMTICSLAAIDSNDWGRVDAVVGTGFKA